jgi:hypothetical protein
MNTLLNGRRAVLVSELAPHGEERRLRRVQAMLSHRLEDHEANGRASPFETRAKWRAPQGEEQQLGVFMVGVQCRPRLLTLMVRSPP